MSATEFEFDLGERLKTLNLTLSIAESCTGGLIAHLVTNVPGSSQYFESCVVSYSNESKIELLKVPPEVIAEYGAVSEQTASAMAKGIRTIAGTDLGLGITGIAGPTGGTPNKPLGLVYISLATVDNVNVFKHQFSGSREEIKIQTARAALKIILDYLNSVPPCSELNIEI